MTSGLIFLVQVLIVVVLPVAVLRVSRLKGMMPLVVIQILVGIALGPSLFGRFAPEWYQLFFNAQALSHLSGIASVAVLFFGLVTGLHLEPSTFRGNRTAFGVIATASVLVPTGLGVLAGLWILWRHPEELGARAAPFQYAIAFGICTGVTALPVLGAILYEMGLLGRRIGNLALGIAGINDGALWILLGLLLTTLSGPAMQGIGMWASLIVLPLYVTAMVLVVRPLLDRLVTARMRNGEVHENALAIVCAVAIGSALITEALGLHYILGAFVTGAVMPEHLRKPILDRVQVMTLGLLMPFFFLLTGLRTHIDLSLIIFEVFVIATVASIAGKLAGTAVAARAVGESWPVGLCLGALLQTQGLMLLIVLTILLDAGVISSNVFSALILMAIASTALAMPLARFMLARDPELALTSEPRLDRGS